MLATKNATAAKVSLALTRLLLQAQSQNLLILLSGSERQISHVIGSGFL